MSSQLTPNGVSRLCKMEQDFQPIVQILEITTGDKMKAVISDGTHYILGALASQLHQVVNDGTVKAHSVVKLTQSVTRESNGKKMVMVLNLEFVSQPEGAIGSPVHIDGGKPSASAPAPVQQPPRTTPTLGRSTGPIAAADPSIQVLPIEALNPYQNKWTIRARVTSKSDKKSWSNTRGSGTLFKIELTDEDGGEIAAAFFKDACEKYFDMIHEGHVYHFSNGKLKVSNRQFSSVNNNHEITFGSDAIIEEVQDTMAIKAVTYHFRKFDKLEAASNSTVDLIAIVKSFGDLQELVSKRTGQNLVKRDLVLVDDTDTEVSFTLWGDKAREDDSQWSGNPVMAVKKVKVSDYNGCSLSSLQSSQFNLNPSLPEADALREWWTDRGQTSASRNISRQSMGGSPGKQRDTSLTARKSLSSIKDESLGYSEKGDFLTVKATVTRIFRKDNADPWYVSEPDTKYKCTEAPDGTWFCERSNRTVENPKRRYILSIILEDYSGKQLVNVFDREAELLLGMSADDMYALKTNGEDDKIERAFADATFNDYVCTLKVKQERYQEENRLKTVSLFFAKPDIIEEARQLIKAIKMY